MPPRPGRPDAARPGYRLVRRPAAPAAVPELDADQRAAVDHERGPLLVLAGPGTGKTTTLVESVLDRVERRGVDPERILVLTFSRKAAGELRERITARLARTVREPVARTFHSYAFGVLRADAAGVVEETGAPQPAPRLLSGAEQDLVIRDLLKGDVELGLGSWPERLRPALLTRGFAEELRDLLLRAHERGVDAARLARLAEGHDRLADLRDVWPAAARFMKQYDGVTALAQGRAFDTGKLVRAALEVLGDPRSAVGARERAAYDWVFVDEYQDSDPGQIALLRSLVPGGGNLVAVGDPYQSIYAFRGADPDCCARFPTEFRTREGAPAEVLRLRTCRRSGGAVVAAGEELAARLSHGRRRTEDRLTPLPDRATGSLEVCLAGSQSQEGAQIAGLLRRAHLVDGVAWSDMAVLVRSSTRLAALRRALVGAGVPVVTPTDEIPLAAQGGLAPLLDVFGWAVSPETEVDEGRAVTLVTSSLGGVDVLSLRRLRRELRHIDGLAGGQETSGVLLAQALLSPGDAILLPDFLRRPVERVVGVLAAARTAATTSGATAEDVLWAIWSTSGLAERWQAMVAAGGPRGAVADRDLDAAVALFEAAARFVDRLPGSGPAAFLDHLIGQEIPGDSLAQRAPEGEAVRLLTAHAAKGLEWRLVVVAGVQEGVWPDLRQRGSLLGSERLVELVAHGEVLAGGRLGELLDEELRLFYVAVTRAAEQLVVTAVDDVEAGELPSRFINCLGAVLGAQAPPPGPLDLVALVGELRRAVSEPTAESGADELRAAAAACLATLAAAGVPGADPADWYGLLPLSDDRPLRGTDEQVPVSPSRVQSYLTCPLRWLLESVGGTDGDGLPAGVGSLVHEVAALAVDPDLRTEAALLHELDRRWGSLELGNSWQARQQRGAAEGMVRNFVAWLEGEGRRDLVGTEVPVRVEVGRALITGRVDRLERDSQGRAYVVDLKTGSSKPRDDELAVLPQLAIYQLAAEAGAFAEAHALSGSGGASLLQVGKARTTKKSPEQVQAALSEAADPRWAEALLADAAEGMAGSAFAAVGNDGCRSCPVRTSCPAQPSGRQVVSP